MRTLKDPQAQRERPVLQELQAQLALRDLMVLTELLGLKDLVLRLVVSTEISIFVQATTMFIRRSLVLGRLLPTLRVLLERQALLDLLALLEQPALRDLMVQTEPMALHGVKVLVLRLAE